MISSNSGFCANGRLTCQPGEDGPGYDQIAKVEGNLEDAGSLGITNKGMQDVTQSAIFAQKLRGVPELRGTERDPAEFLHVLYCVRQQPGSKDQKENTHNTEEDTKVEPIAKAVDQPAQYH